MKPYFHTVIALGFIVVYFVLRCADIRPNGKRCFGFLNQLTIFTLRRLYLVQHHHGMKALVRTSQSVASFLFPHMDNIA